MMSKPAIAIASVILILGAVAPAVSRCHLAAAQPARPKPPDEYNVHLRYQINALGGEHVAQFDQMVAYFKSIGFNKVSEYEGERENRNLNRMLGTIASANARKLLNERHVRTVLLVPRGAELPAEADQPVRVQIELASGLGPQQRPLADQVRSVLTELGFREAIGYDNRSNTRLVGMIGVGRLETLMGDLRWLPAGTALLPRTILNDLRRTPDGEALLQTILFDVIVHPEGRKRVQALLGEKREEVSSEELLNRLTQQTRQGVAGAELLARLFDGVRQGPGSADLLRTIVGYLENSPVRLYLPILFKTPAPARLIEVMTGMEPIAARPAPPEVPPDMVNIGPELRALLADPEQAAKPARMEVILAATPAPGDDSWQARLRDVAPGLLIDGRLGQLVSVQGPATHARALAALPIVSAVRLAMSARPQTEDLPAPTDMKEALRASGLDRLHALGHRGQGVRVAVIDGDFRGWSEQLGQGLPEGTTLIDLTRERNRDLEPDLVAGDPKVIGHGTRCALLLMQAAPEAALTLIRIDPAAPYQLQEVARHINGELFRSLSLDARAEEIQQDFERLEQQRPALIEERRRLLDTVEPSDEFRKKWEAYQKKQEEFDRAERDYHARLARYLRLYRDLRGLKGVAVVACPLVWNEGHPMDGTSALSRYFDDRPFKAALWFQSAGNTRGQAWTGLFRDADGNGVMEFVAPSLSPRGGEGEGLRGIPLPEGRWSPELNFLAWQPAPLTPNPSPPGGGRGEEKGFPSPPGGGEEKGFPSPLGRGRGEEKGFPSPPGGGEERKKDSPLPPWGERGRGEGDGRGTVPDIPAKVRLRVSIQWREAHDPTFLRRGEDVYRVPLAELRLVILRQRDPSGTNLPADDFEVVAQSAGVPLRLDNQPTAATYEQSVEFTAEAGGRYALRVEGRAPEGTRPRGMPTLPAAQQSSELRPRIFVQTLAGPGRAVFADFTTDRPGRGFEGGSLGIPADAHRVITVGAADRAGRPQPYSAGGPPMNQDLTIKPDVLAYDVPAAKDGPYGTSLATTFAAGLAATAISAGVPRSAFLETLQVRPGTLLRIPTDWPARRP